MSRKFYEDKEYHVDQLGPQSEHRESRRDEMYIDNSEEKCSIAPLGAGCRSRGCWFLRRSAPKGAECRLIAVIYKHSAPTEQLLHLETWQNFRYGPRPAPLTT